MATKPVILPARDAGLAFWREFQQQINRHVRECNATAGSLLWVTAATAGSAPKFTISSTVSADDKIDCSFDADRGILACTPGPAVNARPVRFQWVGGTVDTLRSDGRDFSLEEALRLVLDELVSVEEE